jgi:diguanylate cyclase (GGDEF)-like protein
LRVNSGIEVPLEAAVLLCALSALLAGWATKRRTVRRLDPRRDPLRDMLKPATLGPAIDLAMHRDAQRRVANAVLHARIDQLEDDPSGWTPEAAEALRAHVAAVVRVALRRQDRIEMGDGAHFTILIPGADERAAVRIAERLRQGLAQLSLPQTGPKARLTVSFGVAVDRVGESRETLERRAARALAQAVALGADHVVPASEVEEIPLLPPPAPAVSAA